jgi:DNA-binding CsgD family transcriptional regulator
MEANQVMAQSNELSKREWEVAELLLQGKSNKQIALALGIAEHTVEFHLKNIYKKLGVSSRAEAIIKLGKSVGTSIVKVGETAVELVDENPDNGNRSIFRRHGISVMSLKISLQEISEFLVTYKIPIFIWLLTFLIAVIVFIFVQSNKTAWIVEREGEYPDESTVGMVLQRADASDQMVHGQFGTIPAWPAQPGYVKYDNIKTPRGDHLFLKLRYSKHSSSDVLIFVYLDDELAPRAKLLPVNQSSWDKFVWTDTIDLGSVTRGTHSIKFYTDGQEYGVADLDMFVLTMEPP